MSSPSRVLLAGATGALGSGIASFLAANGRPFRALTRSAERAAPLRALGADVRLGDATEARTIAGLCDGIDVVVSALGASVALGGRERRSFAAVDTRANLLLLEEARRAGVRRFVYVGVHAEPGYAATRYVQAHERVERALAASGLSYTVVKPVGLFSAMTEYLDFARRGTMALLGDGSARTNPIHEAEVARVVVEHLDAGPVAVSLGGTEVLTRKEIALLAFAAVGRPPKFVSIPPALMRGLSRVARVASPRVGELMEFVARVSVTDAVAPRVGERGLGEYLREAEGGGRKAEG